MTAPQLVPVPPPPLPPPAPAWRPPPGSDALVAVLAGLAISGAILLVVIAWPAAIAWGLAAPILAGIAVRRARHAVTVVLATLAPPIGTSLAATCLTGAWGWLVVGIVLAAAVLLAVTPLGFGLGRWLRPRVPPWLPRVALAAMVAGGLLAVLGWGVVVADAIAPGTCPPGPGG